MFKHDEYVLQELRIVRGISSDVDDVLYKGKIQLEGIAREMISQAIERVNSALKSWPDDKFELEKKQREAKLKILTLSLAV